MITKESIENLKSHLDIVDVISQFIELKKSGANFKACCPFHGEETASFVVSPAKQIYHCFGCGVGGDSIKFVMEYDKLSYPEALEKLATMSNVSLEYDNNFKKIDSSIIQRVNEHYQKLLTHNEESLKYLKSRGISDFSIEKFEIGYASSSNDTINFLKTSFLNLADAKEFGIIDTGQSGLYSRFIERITFPIYTINGAIVGFGGRTISGHNAKYVNSPQTKLFNKSRLLYGYNLAKEMIYKQKTVIVTEGYLDVIMLHQAGFSNAIATLGTALTADHLPLLKRGDPKVIVAYDGDKAGLNAAYKASLLLSHSSFDGGVVIFTDGQDPADMVNGNKIDELNTMFSNTTPFIVFVIDFIVQKYDLSNAQEKQSALKEANEYLKTLSPILQEEYASLIARKLNINSQLVQVQHFDNQRSTNLSLSSIDISELSIIKTVLDNPELLEVVKKELEADMFEVHGTEYAMMLQNPEDPSLMGLMLNEHIISYTKEELNNQLIIILIPYYKKKLQQLNFDETTNYREKVHLTRKLKYKLIELNSQKLIVG
ncbi:MAG: DNA primase [Arcobacteraceae bacterium]